MEREPRPGLSLIAGIAAVVLAVLLSIVLYYAIGFPMNVPVAVGFSLAAAEVAEVAARRRSGPRSFAADRPSWGPAAARALVHGFVAGGASWLGVLVAQGLGLI